MNKLFIFLNILQLNLTIFIDAFYEWAALYSSNKICIVIST